jgi:large subunit ribosomal protein L23
MRTATEIIKKPIVTEKSTFLSGEQKRYTFLVDGSATKPQIRQAVEELYGVRVVAVATQVRPGKLRRSRRTYIRTSPTKRAVVKVHEDDRIELF